MVSDEAASLQATSFTMAKGASQERGGGGGEAAVQVCLCCGLTLCTFAGAATGPLLLETTVVAMGLPKGCRVTVGLCENCEVKGGL